MARLLILALIPFYLVAAVPARAGGGAIVPEPSDLALFALGLLGLVIGRQGIIRLRRNKPDEDGQ